MTIRKSNNWLTKDTLLKIGLTGIIIFASATSPFLFNQIVKSYFKDKVRKVRAARAKRLRELQKRKLISFEELPNNLIKIKLSHLGKEMIRQYNLEDMKLKKPSPWDKKWHLVMYDIPHHHKQARDAFREKLKSLGLYRLQKSIWVSPYECLPEIEFLCAVFNLEMDRYVLYFSTSEIPRQSQIKHYFGLA